MLCHRAPLALVLVIFSPPLLRAQLTSATITGQITDASKSALPGASITAVDKATGATFKATTNAEGTYVLTNLSPDTYRLTVTMAGFQTGTQEDLVIQVGEHATIDVALQVGATTESVAVEGSAVDVNRPSPR
jgi:hypothetical protein